MCIYIYNKYKYIYIYIYIIDPGLKVLELRDTARVVLLLPRRGSPVAQAIYIYIYIYIHMLVVVFFSLFFFILLFLLLLLLLLLLLVVVVVVSLVSSYCSICYLISTSIYLCKGHAKTLPLFISRLRLDAERACKAIAGFLFQH